MKFCVDTDNKNSWYIGTNNFDAEMANKMETLMFQGNGYFGIRATSEERQLNERRNMFVSGTFDEFPSEVTELPNLPDLLNMEFKIDGETLSLAKGQIKGYHKYLNLKNGELVRKFSWLINGKRVDFKYSRFISMSDKHLLVSKVEIASDQDNLNIQVRSGIDGQQSNSETQHLMEGDKRLYEDKYLQLMEETQQSHIKFVFNARHNVYIDEVLLSEKPFINMGRRQIFANYDIHLNQGQHFSMTKYASVYTSIDRDVDQKTMAEKSVSRLKQNCAFNYDEQLRKSTKVWEKDIWQKNTVKISAKDIRPQVAINFARYQLAANTPRDTRMNIGAKGITGEGYKGHTFWDTEVFMLPYYIFTMPNVAHDLLRYRYHGLAGAHKKAQFNNYRGAQFPWEAAWPDDGESAPLWGSADIVTGEPMKIWSGFIEQHVTSDVVIAIMDYINATNDQNFAQKMGYEMILDAAIFWSSRLEYNRNQDRYEINDVIGPDEYKEHVDNNAYTNYTARWCLQKAIKVYNLIKTDYPNLYEKLDTKLDLTKNYADWLVKVNKIYLPQPNADGVIPENDQYLDKKIIDVSRYQVNNQLSSIFKDYNLSQINEMQITKQADVLLLIYLFGDLFSDEVKQSNWDYYEPKTTHDSSLSLSTHSILASDLNLDDSAYKFYERACETDLGIHAGKAAQGLHMAACGGVWNMTVEGFGGVRIENGKLKIEPHLPLAWDGLEYQITWHGSALKVKINNDKLAVEVIGKGINFISFGEEYQIPANSEIEITLPVIAEV
ncbi:glycoside hydrolase family 65 protein [Companilactobacillus halodurans]|uniref:Glycoside hydrolase family 65 protein n=1 Tax=Companilactobacillus halodurans TaxID=2584183 RepID=A0A5P0ZTM3_9LACO|nr:glycosyl hydrolase family 65 protein [Companilactobacillus halodurans]MQS75959.1 glycoside hydrolase family 65 protein [Companilactobacillus halodurans]MQS96393.1 glycoside hydrolase family 65 protein [Companilactobacillus halodurans]